MITLDQPNPQKDSKSIGWAWALCAVPFTLFIYFFGQLLGYLSFILIANLTGHADSWWNLSRLEGSVAVQFFLSLAIQAAVIGLLGLAMLVLRISARAIGLIRPKLRDIAYGLIGYVGYFSAFYIILMITSHLFSGINLDQPQKLGFDTSVSGLHLVPIFVSLVLLPPIVEEIVMRGFLFSGLRTKLSFAITTIITSILFAIAHLQFGTGASLLWVAAIDTFILSVVLCYLREKSGSLAAPIMLHGLKNFIAFAVLFIFKIA